MPNTGTHLKDKRAEYWRDIPGYEGRYQASTEGRVRSLHADGKKNILKPYLRTQRYNCKEYYYSLRSAEGKVRSHAALRIVAMTWLPLHPGLRVYHKNGLHSDNSVYNVGFCTSSELGHRSAPLRHNRGVIKISRSGEILATYRSATAAAEDNHITMSAICNRCNGKIKDPYRLDDSTYQWEYRK